jgi:hypothetical protein
VTCPVETRRDETSEEEEEEKRACSTPILTHLLVVWRSAAASLIAQSELTPAALVRVVSLT